MNYSVEQFRCCWLFEWTATTMRTVVLITLIGLTIALPVKNSATLGKNVCPSTMRKCSCITFADGVRVSCSAITNRIELKADLKDLTGYRVDQLTMSRSKITLESNDLSSISLLNMDVESSDFNLLTGSEGFFAHQEKPLIAMKVQNSIIDFGDMVPNNATVTSLFFDNCTFRNYKNEWFDGLRVNRLTVDQSSMMTEFVARGLRNLEKYTHTRSNVKHIGRDMLPKDGRTLRELDFSNNAIESISDDFLVGMDALQSGTDVGRSTTSSNPPKIDLSNNQLKTLNEAAFKNFSGFLSLSNNPLVCDANLLWLTERLIQKTIRQRTRLTCFDEKGTRSISDLKKEDFEKTRR